MTNDFSFPGLAGRTCVISGGAGILGQAICKGLAGAGIQTAILDINMESAARLAGDLQSEFKTRCIGIGANVLIRESLENAREKILAELGPVDFLINGAGGNSAKATTTVETHHDASLDASLPDQKTFFDLDQAGFQFVFDLNFTGTVLTTQVFGEDMAQRGSGVILNISSMNSFRPLTKIPAYSAAKASINNFTQWLSVHLAQSGVRVNAIAPGFFLTDQNRFLLTEKETGAPTTRGKKIIANTPMGKYGQPEDLQGAVLFLLSEASSFITGIILPVDGGYSAYGGV
ncbi:MAG: D-mannonate oxidoreductase [Bacteroidetes bacterium GWF2_49_14]|nr:MAG: D-mannonate oxidoreductase [Bacteroidetes bacterium GWF2_49_14]HBB90473.1 D-mannonate oxidoreductase [Bacteroidales bacterium]